jgi:muramoyltetrapeptide carboxypeptidase
MFFQPKNQIKYAVLMIIPPYLKKGDTIAIVATAGKIALENVMPAVKMMERWGLNVILGENLFAVQNQFAGSDQQRLDDFQSALNNPQVKAIVSARGGYGTNRIIDDIDFDALVNQPKWIAGYSDVTVLHNHIQRNLNMATIHSTMPLSFPKDGEPNQATISLQKALFGIDYGFKVEQDALNRQGMAEGVLTGGNLSIIYSLMGTASQIDTAGKVLLIEDLNEYLYHLDRMMVSLQRCGVFHGLAGLIVGGFTGMKDNDVPFGKRAEEIILEAVKEFNFPVAFGFPVGHGECNEAIIFGKMARLEVKKEGSILNYI